MEYNFSENRVLVIIFIDLFKFITIKFPYADWTSIENRKKFFDYLMQQLGYKTLDDFYNIN